MKLSNILKEKKTSIIGFLLALSTMAKVMGWIPDDVAGGLTAFIPETVNFIIVLVLALSKDGKE
jgi:hypothetical protein